MSEIEDIIHAFNTNREAALEDLVKGIKNAKTPLQQEAEYLDTFSKTPTSVNSGDGETILDWSADKRPAISIAKKCPFCKGVSQIKIALKDYNLWHNQGWLIQNVWPNVSVDDRELLITGTHPKCWDEAFGDNDDA